MSVREALAKDFSFGSRENVYTDTRTLDRWIPRIFRVKIMDQPASQFLVSGSERPTLYASPVRTIYKETRFCQTFCDHIATRMGLEFDNKRILESRNKTGNETISCASGFEILYILVPHIH